MTPHVAVKPDHEALIEQLAAHRTLSGIPRSELEWLATHGEFRHYDTGELAARRGDPVDEMIIQLSGRTSTSVNSGSGRRYLLDTHGGDVTALLPFSRLTTSLGDVVIAEPTDAIIVRRDQFSELIRECPRVIETLVHVMLDRSRYLTSTSLQDDKMASLGRLAAGLAHELNNPASAAARSAKRLGDALAEAHSAARALGAAQMTEAQRLEIESLGSRALIPTSTGVFSAIERADHEDTVVDWLETHGASLAPASTLSETGITTDSLDELAESFSGDALDTALRWIAAEYTTRTLATEIERATTRIYDLVSAVKRFTYMNRDSAVEPTNIAQGLNDTVAMLAAKARAKSVAVRMDVAPNLPLVHANAGELNQVWANLLENALDAVGDGGEIVVRAANAGHEVVVSVIDDGPGIPPDVEKRMFEPFFTTKPIGQGTGLGLDISRRVVQLHEGQIAVDTRPGRTEFRVSLPIERAKAG
jgi:signal transduction histidine kinase